MVLLYKKGDIPCTKITVDYKTDTVEIENYTEDLLDRAFGIIEHPTMKDFEEFIEDRSIPQSRYHFRTEMALLGIEDTSPLGIVKHFHGRCAGDNFCIDFLEE